jgi:hypothetical protein
MSRPGTTIAVCAMGKRPFTTIAGRWVTELGRTGATVHDHRAVVSARQDVLGHLNGYADLVIYLGHGRARGWTGYQTIRRNHLDATTSTRPVKAVLAFACSTLDGDGGTSFGASLVAGDRASCYLGWPMALPIDAGLALADHFVGALTRGAPTIAALLATVERAELDPIERETLAACRVVGDRSVALV